MLNDEMQLKQHNDSQYQCRHTVMFILERILIACDRYNTYTDAHSVISSLKSCVDMFWK